MKKIIVATLLLVLSVAANAQFEQGKIILNTALSGASFSYSSGEKGNFGLDVSGGYFILNDIALTSTFGMDLADTVDQYYFGLGGRYYFEKTGLFLGLGLKTTSYSYKNASDTNDFALTPEAGYAFFISRDVTIEPSVCYNLSFKKHDYSKLGLKIGFSLYF